MRTLAGDTIQSITGQNRSPNHPPTTKPVFLLFFPFQKMAPNRKAVFGSLFALLSPIGSTSTICLFQPLPTCTSVPPHCPFSTQHIIEPIKTSSRLAHSSRRTLQHLRTPLLPRVLVLPRVTAAGLCSFLTLLWRAADGSVWPGDCVPDVLGANIALGNNCEP